MPARAMPNNYLHTACARSHGLRLHGLRLVVALVISSALLSAACAGDRPVLTEDRLETLTAAEESAATTPAATGQLSEDQPADVDPLPTPTAATAGQSEPQRDIPAGVEQLRVVVDATFPHDPTAFTQGLELSDGAFIESTGLYDQSDLRRVAIETGEVLAQTATPDGLFAEGLTRVDDRLIQLTWKAGKAFVWDAESLNLINEFDYEGQGWGLCFSGSELIMTDGSANLSFRDPDTFELTRVVPVMLGDEPITNLNELECVNSDVYINIWMTDQIIRVDQFSGQVNALIDATDLAQPRPEGSNVLNGIAYDRANDAFYLTGKLWPTIHRVRFALETGGT